MSKVLNEERFNPSRLSGLSLWMDAGDLTTITTTSTSNVTTWTDKSGKGNNLVTDFTTSFLPTNIPGCQLWLDATDPNGNGTAPPANNTSISVWGDKSGNSRNLTVGSGTTTYSTYEGRSSIYQNGSYMTYSNSTSTVDLTQYTFFIVALSQLSYTNQTVFAASPVSPSDWSWTSTTGFGLYIDADFPKSRFYGGIYQNYVNDYSTSTSSDKYPLRLMSYTETGTGTLNSYVNGNTGSVQVSSYTRSSGCPGFSLGGEYHGTIVTGATSYTNTSEILVFNRVLSTTERQQIEGYLAWKWGLQGNLPTSHPYYNSFPIITSPTPIFTPKSVSGLYLWLDAADSSTIVKSGTSVTSWNDKSGNNFSATPVDTAVTLQSQNGNSTIYLPNVRMSIPNFTWQYAFTMIIVCKHDLGKMLMGLGTGTNPLALVFTGNWDLIYRTNPNLSTRDPNYTSGGTPTPVAPANQWFIFTIGYNNGSYLTNYGINGTPYNANPVTPVSGSQTGPFIINGWNGSIYGNLQVGEIIHYNYSISTSQRQQIEGYLAWKWGLVGNLPVNHPYKNNPINIYPIVSTTTLNQPSIYFQNGAQMQSIYNSGFVSSVLPTSIPGCQLWLDGADSSTIGMSGTRVVSWADKSGNGYIATQSPLTTGTITKSTQNNLSVIATNSQVMTIPIFSWTAYATIFFVIKTPSWFYCAGSTGYNGYVASFNYGLYNFIGYPTFNDSVLPLGTQVIPTNQWCIFSIGYGGGTQATNYCINGTPRSTTTITPVGNSTIVTPIWFSGRWDTVTGDNAIIGEIIHYNYSISTSQRQQIEGYLAWKWGLQTNLPTSHPYYVSPPSSSKTMIMLYQCPQISSTMRFSVGNDVSGSAFGLAQSNGTVYSPYQYAYGDTYWSVNITAYTLPNVSIAICDGITNSITGNYNFNANLDNRIKALKNTITNTPYVLGTSTNQYSVFTSSNFHVNEIITYNRAISTTERQEIEGYLAWKWNLVNFLPIGHPYKSFPPSGEQVVPQNIAPNIYTGLLLWLDMADTTQYTKSGNIITSISDKASSSLFTIGGNTSILTLSSIGTLPSLYFAGNRNNPITSSSNPFIYKTLNVPPQGSAISIVFTPSQYQSSKLALFSWSNNSPALGFNSPTNANSPLQTYNPSNSGFYGPTLSLTSSSPTIVYWAWYGGNMVYLSCNGNTLLSTTQGSITYNNTSTNNVFYIGNDSGYGANFNLGELCIYNSYLETPFRQIMEGYLAWKWGIESNLPTTHPYYLSAPTLQTLTDINEISFPTDISSLTLWIDADDSYTISNIGCNVVGWTDKSPVINNFLPNSVVLPLLSNFGLASRPSVYFGPGTSMKSLYNSGASGTQFSSFIVASVPNLSYMLISTGQLTTATTATAGNSFAFYAGNGSTSVYSPYVFAGTGITNLTVGNYSTICGTTFELFANSSGNILNGNMVFANTLSSVSNVTNNIAATPWVIGDCSGDTISKSFHLHEMITYSRNLTDSERKSIEGYLYWKWFN